jgi:poly(beta-D-mannuronate) lyase
MAAGLASNNTQLFNWATTVPYNTFLAQLQPNGTLPMEVVRGQQATMYHGFSAGALTTMAVMARANGVDLYSRGDYALRRLNMLVAR